MTNIPEFVIVKSDIAVHLIICKETSQGEIIMKKKVELTFMVVPEYLKSHCFVKDPIKIIVTDPEAIFLTGILGESGRKMVSAGIPFFFKKKLAMRLIEKGIAKQIP